MAKIIGNTTATPNPRPDWAQTDSTKADFIKNKPELGDLATKDVAAKTDLASEVQESLDKADSALQSYTETDPTVPSHVKQITTTDISAWNAKSNFSGSYNDLTNKPAIPSTTGLASETYVNNAVAGKVDANTLATVATSGSYDDLTNKPTIPSITGLATEGYVDEKIATIPTPDVSGQINTHNTNTSAHADIREQISQLSSEKDNLTDRVDDIEQDVISIQAQTLQQTPLYANSKEECTDTTKMYVLPDGFIYAYQYVEATEPSYNNLSKTVHENKRMGSGGALSTLAGAVTTDFIPARKGQTVRFKGFNPLVMPEGKFPYICFYTGASESNVVSSGIWDRLDWLKDDYSLLNQDSNGVWSYTAFMSPQNKTSSSNYQHTLADSITHIRMCGTMIEGETVIVTVDEEITEGGSEGGYDWVNTGHAFVPADYEQVISDLQKEINKKANRTEIQTVPEAIKNPFSLTINGVSYDGSTPVDINIAASSGSSNTENNTNDGNLFSFENADVNFSWISGSAADMIYETSADFGYKDTAHLRFVSRKSLDSGRFAVTGGLPVLPAGEYIVSAEVFMPSAGNPTKKVVFGACAIPSNKAQYEHIPLSAYDTWTKVTKTFTVAEGDVATYIALMAANNDIEMYWRNIKVVSADAYESTESSGYSGNILYGKKWVACGDSFTAGGYNTSDGFDESVYKYQDGRFAGQNIVYPFIIGLRNNMNIVNLATGGQTMATTAADNSFMTRYENIDDDADYITIKLGINDKLQGVQMGALDSTDTSTFCGAFNTAMEYILENHPFAHIGIMVSNGTNAEIMQATRDIAERWGVPYLDYGSPQVPLMNRYTGKWEDDGGKVCTKARQIREKKFCVISDGTTPTNAHPNTAAHEYESTFIEAWLRTL